MPCKVVCSQIPGLGFRHFWKPLFCLPLHGLIIIPSEFWPARLMNKKESNYSYCLLDFPQLLLITSQYEENQNYHLIKGCRTVNKYGTCSQAPRTWFHLHNAEKSIQVLWEFNFPQTASWLTNIMGLILQVVHIPVRGTQIPPLGFIEAFLTKAVCIHDLLRCMYYTRPIF